MHASRLPANVECYPPNFVTSFDMHQKKSLWYHFIPEWLWKYSFHISKH